MITSFLGALVALKLVGLCPYPWSHVLACVALGLVVIVTVRTLFGCGCKRG